MEVGGQPHAPATLHPSKAGGGGGRAGLDKGGNSRPPPGFDPRTVQPVSSCYTDWAIPAREDRTVPNK